MSSAAVISVKSDYSLNLKEIVSYDYFQMDTEVHRVFVVP